MNLFNLDVDDLQTSSRVTNSQPAVNNTARRGSSGNNSRRSRHTNDVIEPDDYGLTFLSLSNISYIFK